MLRLVKGNSLHDNEYLNFLSCTIQNCVLGEGTIVGNNCNLNECYSGKGVRVADNSRLKSETLTGEDRTVDDNELEGDDFDNVVDEEENI